MATRENPNGLSATGLSDDQLLHFSAHGWLVLENVLDGSACRSYIDAIDRCRAMFGRAERNAVVEIDQPHLRDPMTFLRWFEIPGILQANRQLTGDPHIRLNSSHVFVRSPHPDRASRKSGPPNRADWSWHRDFTPRWGTQPSEADDRLVYAPVITNATFLTPVSPADGSTGFLDGSHRVGGADPRQGWLQVGGTDAIGRALEPMEGGDEGFRWMAERCPIVQVSAGAGSIVLFSEALMHAAAPILSERTRYALLNWMGASWTGNADGSTRPHYADDIVDEEVRSLFREPTPGEYPGDA